MIDLKLLPKRLNRTSALIGVRVSEETKRELERLAKVHQVSLSAIVAKLITEFLKGQSDV